MHGVDAICFTAGIGENSDLIREKVCEGLEFMGIEIDKDKNSKREKGNREINTKNSKTKIFVIPTNEELVIATDTYNLLKSKIYKNKKSKLVEFTQKCSFCFFFSLFKHSQKPSIIAFICYFNAIFFIIIFVIFEKRKDWLHHGFN